MGQAGRVARRLLPEMAVRRRRCRLRAYRTVLNLSGAKKGDVRQETDTISRLVYGFATAYLLTGEDRTSKRPRRARSTCATTCASATPTRTSSTGTTASTSRAPSEQKIFASEFGDDYDAIPMYEQIYALAGPTQTYRVTGDPRILSDIEATIQLFDRFYLDRHKGGYFSHLDPVTLDPRAEIARPEPGEEELELGRRPRPGLPDQPVPGDRRGALRRLPRVHRRHDREVLPGLRAQPVRAGAVLRGLEPRHDVGLAAEPRRRRPQPEDRLEPDADASACARRTSTSRWRRRSPRSCRRSAATSSAAAGTTSWSVRSSPGQEFHRFVVARPQGLVAAGAGHPRLPDPGRHRSATSEYSALRARGGGLLQRLLPRPRRRRACTSTCWPTACRT